MVEQQPAPQSRETVLKVAAVVAWIVVAITSFNVLGWWALLAWAVAGIVYFYTHSTPAKKTGGGQS